MPKKLPTKKLAKGIELLPSGAYRARIRIKGVDKSAAHHSLADAKLWLEREKHLTREAAKQGISQKITLSKAVKRYIDEVCVNHKGERYETLRLNAFLRQLPDKSMNDFTAADFSRWKFERTKQVSAGSVIREMGLLSAFFEHCRREWRYINENPLSDVKRPAQPKHRERTVTAGEVSAMCEALGFNVENPKVLDFNQQTAVCMLFAIETGMRSSEIVGLTWANVHLKKRFATLPDTKNGSRRDVPLTTRAVELLELMRVLDNERVFLMGGATRDILFRRARDKAGLEGFTFHDLRHTAATRLAQKVNVLELCKIMGWRNTKQALTYFNPTATDLAAKLG